MFLQKEYYLGKREGVWDRTWDILQSPGWKLASGRDLETGVVYRKHFNEYGNVFRLEVSARFV